jgi:hypothetical protein
MSANKKTRRKFLKIAAAGSLYILAYNFISCSKEVKVIKENQAWKNGMQINPNIDNLRVVCCHDESMLTGDPDSWKMAAQNAPVVPEQVHKNLDQMAKSLAQVPDATSAWRIIFQKPQNKQWQNVRVAIKVNASLENHPRLAVVEKICNALHGLGIPYENIIIYDAISDASKHYTDAVGKELPDKVIISKDGEALGGWTGVYIPSPRERMVKCVKDIAEGKIDILVNIIFYIGLPEFHLQFIFFKIF